MTGARAVTLGVAGPPLIWAAHFAAVYVAIAGACGPRGALAPAAGPWVVLAATLLALAGVAALAAPALRRRGEGSGKAPRTAALWSAAISAIAIVAGGLPTLILSTCA